MMPLLRHYFPVAISSVLRAFKRILQFQDVLLGPDRQENQVFGLLMICFHYLYQWTAQLASQTRLSSLRSFLDSSRTFGWCDARVSPCGSFRPSCCALIPSFPQRSCGLCHAARPDLVSKALDRARPFRPSPALVSVPANRRVKPHCTFGRHVHSNPGIASLYVASGMGIAILVSATAWEPSALASKKWS
jgi:hypothetical protein